VTPVFSRFFQQKLDKLSRESFEVGEHQLKTSDTHASESVKKILQIHYDSYKELFRKGLMFNIQLIQRIKQSKFNRKFNFQVDCSRRVSSIRRFSLIKRLGSYHMD